MNLSDYVQDVSKRFAQGNAREHTYRGTLQNLLEDTIPNIQATNEPARIKCGAPDYVLTRKNIPVGYIEAKDIGVDLNKTEKDEQLSRYLDSLENLILTDYLEFRFFRNKQKVETIRIAEIDGKTIRPLPENFDRLKTMLIDFAAFQGQTIKSAKKLAEMMAGKAKMMRDVFKATLEAEDDSTLKDQMRAFKAILMHDLDAAQFADIYAQTITYGLFTARLHDDTPDSFSRGEALTLIPASNPFLRDLFTYVASAQLDHRAVWIVDALCEVYRATDLKAILKDFGTATGQNDPILHFYETFLGAYDKNLRKARGVWYTPEPVVQFIVRAIDDVLKDHFGLQSGLATTDKIDIEVESDRINKRTGKREMDKKQVHKVQMLDVATGTGTFLAEAVKQIYTRFKGQEGLWSRYVDDHLLPRLHGFELLMASYAMCHMKLDMLLQETGYKPLNPNKPPRVSVYLTNSLEEHHPDADTLFASFLSKEANAASRIKRDMPIMVAFGNPPYSVSSTNKGAWIQNLIADYKKNLNERKINLDDDYIKFIRYAEHYIERTGYGIVAMITNNSFLDGVTHRQMRKHLLETFDTIYIYDLHGSAKKKETAPDGSKDENVFDIQQGVSISIFVKTQEKSKKLADVYHADSFGLREDKYDRLENENLKKTEFSKIKYEEPYYFFVPKDFQQAGTYNQFFSICDLFPIYTSGIETQRDSLAIHFETASIQNVIKDISELDTRDFSQKYALSKDGRDWTIAGAKKDVGQPDCQKIKKILYRPYDLRWTYYTGNSKGFVAYPRHNVMKHLMGGDNVALITSRITKGESFAHISLSKTIVEKIYLSGKTSNNAFIFPLYIKDELSPETKNLNLNKEIYSRIKNITAEIGAIDLLDYICAVLHAPAYRERYAEFLKSDFPRIPYPEDSKTFHALAKKGAELRTLHLMESPALDNFITTYPVDGDHAVDKPVYRDGNVYINADQYFGNVPEIAWNFYIGGYQPAQKWLKDRRGRNLSIDDIMHYQRIIIALTETDKIMKEIDTIKFLPDGEA
ncbi:MAG: type ISP restriction/modification enzyme [Micavibrio sp.]